MFTRRPVFYYRQIEWWNKCLFLGIWRWRKFASDVVSLCWHKSINHKHSLELVKNISLNKKIRNLFKNLDTSNFSMLGQMQQWHSQFQLESSPLPIFKKIVKKFFIRKFKINCLRIASNLTNLNNFKIWNKILNFIT